MTASRDEGKSLAFVFRPSSVVVCSPEQPCYNPRMFKDDYIVRVIAQATAALATAIGLRKAGRRDEALHLVDQTLQQFWGLNLGMAGQLPIENLLALARWQETLDLGKLVILADVFQTEADIY